MSDEPLMTGEEEVIRDPVLGKQAWVAQAARIAALGPLPAHLPRLDLRYAAGQIFPLTRLLQTHRAGILAQLAEQVAGEVGGAIDRLHTVSHATYYVAVRCTTEQVTPAEARQAWSAMLSENYRLRTLGLLWLDILVLLGVIPAAVVEALRSGRGHGDLADDLIAIAALLERHAALLAALQAYQADPEQRLPEQSAILFQQRGAQLAEALADEQARPTVRPEFDWRQQLLAMHELLRQDYELVRHPAIYYLKRQGLEDEAARFQSLDSMRRRPDKPRPKPATPPDQPPPA